MTSDDYVIVLTFDLLLSCRYNCVHWNNLLVADIILNNGLMICDGFSILLLGTQNCGKQT